MPRSKLTIKAVAATKRHNITTLMGPLHRSPDLPKPNLLRLQLLSCADLRPETLFTPPMNTSEGIIQVLRACRDSMDVQGRVGAQAQSGMARGLRHP